MQDVCTLCNANNSLGRSGCARVRHLEAIKRFQNHGLQTEICGLQYLLSLLISCSGVVHGS